ncbi:MAG: thioredoxin-disulfide reductase [Gemmatimonadetes bacterium]|nr:thioredoxin-disulfide reductase [Gemmatimonadota bacterium]
MSESRNVVIIGSGPAGHTAALYAARANLEPLLYAGSQPGGQLTITTDVENYPGFPDGVMGPELMQLFEQQSSRFGTEIRSRDVTRVDLGSRPFKIEAEDEEILAKTLIIATGASAMLLGIENEQKLMGMGVSACATCDGFFYREKEVAIVGGGDTAMEEALFLTRYASKVTVIHRRDALRASQIMQQKAMASEKIAWCWDSVVEDILGDAGEGGVRAIAVKNVKSGAVSELAVDGIFIAIGHKPNTALFEAALEMDEVGYLSTAPHTTHTSVEGVFAAGDVADARYRQAISAAGSGCMAAIDAERFLSEHE